MAEFNTPEDKFLDDHSDFSLRERVEYPNGGGSRFYDNDVDMVIIDENICGCEDKKSYFRYMLITDKQNTCALWGIKLFRFSTEDCAFENRIEDDIKQYFGKDTSDFIDNGLKIDRAVELYEHQTISLQEIKKRRDAGIKAFLIVLPTAAGKSKIVEEDIKDFAGNRADFKALVLVPGNNILADWIDRVRDSLPELTDKIDIRTYAYMARHYTDYRPDYYNYVVVDETVVAGLIQRYPRNTVKSRVSENVRPYGSYFFTLINLMGSCDL